MELLLSESFLRREGGFIGTEEEESAKVVPPELLCRAEELFQLRCGATRPRSDGRVRGSFLDGEATIMLAV